MLRKIARLRRVCGRDARGPSNSLERCERESRWPVVLSCLRYGKTSPFFGRKAAWLVLVAIAVVAFAVVAAPVWIIQPFPAANGARCCSLLYVTSLVSLDNPPFVGVCSVPCRAALAGLALVEESVSRNRVHSFARLDLVRAAEPFRMDV